MGRALLRVAGVEHSFRADATARRARRCPHRLPTHVGRASCGDLAPHPSHRVLPCTHLPSRIIAVMAFDLVKLGVREL